MNALAIYDLFRKSWNNNVIQQAIYLSYKAMKKQRKDLANYTVLHSLECHVPLPCHFGKTIFTLGAMDTFDNAVSLFGRKHA